MINLNSYAKLQVYNVSNGVFHEFNPEIYKLNEVGTSKNHCFLLSHQRVLIYRKDSLCNDDCCESVHGPQPVNKLQCEDEINYLRCYPSKEKEQMDEKAKVWILATGESGLVKLFCVCDHSGQLLYELKFNMPQPESAWSIACSKDYVVCGSNNHNLTVWRLNYNNGSIVQTDVEYNNGIELKGHDHNIPCVDMHPDLNLVASASIDSTIRIWNLDAGENEQALLSSWKIPHISNNNLLNRLRAFNRNQFQEELEEKEWAWSVRWYPQLSKNCKKVSREIFEKEYEFVERNSNERVRLMGNIDLDICQITSDRLNQSSVPSRLQQILTQNGDFLIATSKHHIYLLDSQLHLQHHLYYCPRRLSYHLSHALVSGFSRLSLIEIVPEFSCFLIASQTDNRVLIVRILKSEDNRYLMRPEAIIPNNEPDITSESIYLVGSFHVAGILPNGCGFQVRIVYLNRTYRIFNVLSGLSSHVSFLISEALV